MKEKSIKTKSYKIIDDLPSVGESAAVYYCTQNPSIDAQIIPVMDAWIHIKDTILAKWINITPRTLRNYRENKKLKLKSNTKEHIILLLSLYKHGIELFDTTKLFEKWLSERNPLLDNTAPEHFLNTISGIKFIDNRLSAMEYGENV